MTGAPAVEHDLGLSHARYLLLAFALPLVVAAVLEGAIALVSDRTDRRRLLLAGQAVLAASLLLLAWVRSAWGLTLGLAVAGTSSGVASGAAQALLLSADGRGADRAMLRWTLFAAVGDVLTPIVTGGAIALGYSYRGAMLAIAGIVLVQCFALARTERRATPAETECADADAADEPLAAALVRAMRRPRLWAWLLAAASCTLLDELVVALAVLRMRAEQGVSESWAAAAAVTFAAGSIAGSALVDRVVGRLGARAVLVGSSVACLAALPAAALPASAFVTGAALFALGLVCAPHNALSQARAYGELPGRPGTVQALSQVFVVCDVAAPLALGWVADHLGLRAAIASLALQPLVVGLCAATLKPAKPA